MIDGSHRGEISAVGRASDQSHYRDVRDDLAVGSSSVAVVGVLQQALR